MPFDPIPNDVRNRLGGISKDIADANLNFGQSIISGWPGYPTPGIYPREAMIDLTCKWEEKFKYYINDAEVVRDAFTIQFKYTLYNTTDEGKVIPGMPITVPYDMSNLPAPAVKGDGTPNVKQKAEMALSRLSTQLRLILAISEEEFKQRVAAGTIVAILEAVGQKMAASVTGGVPLSGKVNFQIRKYEYTDQKTKEKKSGLDGSDTIIEVTSATPAAIAAMAKAQSQPPV